MTDTTIPAATELMLSCDDDQCVEAAHFAQDNDPDNILHTAMILQREEYILTVDRGGDDDWSLFIDADKAQISAAAAEAMAADLLTVVAEVNRLNASRHQSASL